MWLFIFEGALAKEKKATIETRLGVADVEQVLDGYWRTPRVRAELERYKTSEQFRKKEMEMDRLERELSGRRFGFFGRSLRNEKIRQKQSELKALAEEEARRVRGREKEAVEELLADIRRAAEAIGRERQLTAIFDCNTPHILFLNTNTETTEDVTNEVIENLNLR